MNTRPDSVASIAGLAQRYGDTLALDGIDLEIPAGCMAGLIGPDGVGKSSLLSLLAGARRIQSGTVHVLGSDMAKTRERNAVQPRIAYMPQGLGKNLYPSLSVYENVTFFGRLFGQGRVEREARIAELLESTGLAPFRDRPAAKLSGGMKQKLGLCCALIHDPSLLILDEPTTGVDPLSRRQFWTLIDHIRARRPGMSVLIATAYMEEADSFDWLAAMDGGRILASGRPEKLKARTGSASLEEAFIALLPEARRRTHQALVIPPQREQDGGYAIEADGLSQRFGDFTAVDKVSFRIGQGEIFGFLGSNGCGKTTTMKMLTGLLPPSEGSARLFGQPVDAADLATRTRVGYMSQSFSLYNELSVAQNLELHARLFHLAPERIPARLDALSQRFGLTPYLKEKAEALPLGIRQRLSLAVAVVHEPKLLILDEPTSGVDPVARDEFWQLLIELSREHGVTIFISTHFMNEAERCDRISLMHAGRVLASDRPAALQAAKGAATLEEAFIAYLEEATGQQAGALPETRAPKPVPENVPAAPAAGFALKLRRLLGVALRETLELRRDPIRLGFALFGSLILMFVLGYGISMDVEGLRFGVLDRDQSPESRAYVQNIAGSRYFVERPPVRDDAELEQRMRSGELSLALEIPPGFGKDLKSGRKPEIGAWVDGAMPYRGETLRGYLQGMHSRYLDELTLQEQGRLPALPADIAVRYRYNQDYKSLYAMVPAVIPLLLVLIPSILMALGVVREKELGSIVNLYVTPVTRLEFLLGKQLPYVVLSMGSFAGLVLEAVFGFGVPLKGSVFALCVGAWLYVCATTALGLLASTFTRTQIAALFGTAILTMLPTVQFSGFTSPVASLEGAAYWIGLGFPASYFLAISRGVFTKALGFHELASQFWVLAAFAPLLLGLTLLLLPKQER